MSTNTVTETTELDSTEKITAGVGGGLAGGVVFGAMMTMLMPDIIGGAIPGMYGLGASLATGWAIHLFHSAVLGAVFAGIVATKPAVVASTPRAVGVGVAYGVVLWVVLATFVMPAWVGVMTPMSPPVPSVNPMSLVGHVAYGGVLGAIYTIVARR